jgi:hypothetical protein
MEKLIFFIILTLNIIGCKQSDNILKGDWVIKYYSYSLDGEEKYHYPKIILSFDSDSVVINRFIFEFEESEVDKITAKYVKEKNIVVIFLKEGNDTLEVLSLTNKEFIFIGKDSQPSKYVCEKLKRFKQGKNKDKLLNQLKNTVYKDDLQSIDSSWIEFRENYIFYNSELLSYLTSNQFWDIQTFEGELFLILDGLNDVNIHIRTVNNNNIEGIVYKKENLDLKYTKIGIKPYFDTNKLEGEWEEIEQKEVPPPDWNRWSKKFYSQENLQFTKEKVIWSKFFKSDTTIWSTNTLQNQIIFPEMWDSYKHKHRKWIIESLSENRLTVRRLEEKEFVIEPQIRKFERK